MKNGCIIENPPTSNKTYTFEQVQNVENRHIMDTINSRDADVSKIGLGDKTLFEK